MCARVQHTCGNQKTICLSQCYPTIQVGSKDQIKSSGLAANAIISLAMSLAPGATAKHDRRGFDEYKESQLHY